MSLRIDTSDLIPGALVIGVTSLGVPGASIPTSGEHGASLLANDVDPGDEAKEFRLLLGTPTLPAGAKLFVWETGEAEITDASDGSYSVPYTLYVDGVQVGDPVAGAVTVGASAAQVSSDLSLSWSVAQRVSADLGLAWAVAQQVSADLGLSWVVDGIVPAQVSSDLLLSWSVAQRVSSDLSLTWVVQTSAPAQGGTASPADVWNYQLPGGMSAAQVLLDLLSRLAHAGPALAAFSTMRPEFKAGQTFTDKVRYLKPDGTPDTVELSELSCHFRDARGKRLAVATLTQDSPSEFTLKVSNTSAWAGEVLYDVKRVSPGGVVFTETRKINAVLPQTR